MVRLHSVVMHLWPGGSFSVFLQKPRSDKLHMNFSLITLCFYFFGHINLGHLGYQKRCGNRANLHANGAAQRRTRAACPDVLILHLPLRKWGFNYLARERWGFITIPPGNGGANGVLCCIPPLRRGRLITWWISENRSIVKHATLSTLSPVCWEARLTGADSQTFWIAARQSAHTCLCVCVFDNT